uniref:SAC3/GANP/THP3 conserved domain-containing protein n=1 Tax=Caenorhabditis japonica TaxID=281687 RepID=A0A8R1DLU5_CAEJA
MGDWKTRRNRMATCDAMCPLAEIQFRTKNHLINRLEATASSSSDSRSKYVADPSKMVKEYCRSAADTHKYNKPELLRPFPALNMTIDYLLDLYAPFKASRKCAKETK